MGKNHEKPHPFNDFRLSQDLAARLLSLPVEQRNLSTSSFRPPGGPTPTRGFFYLGESSTATLSHSTTGTGVPASPGSARNADGKFAAVLVLAGDIGGTKTALATVRIAPRREAPPTILRVERYASAAYPGLEEIVQEFLRDDSRRERPEAAGFGVAGPVRGGVARITKLPWRVETRRFAARVGIRRVALLNDFVAAALGLPYLTSRQSAALVPGRVDPDGPVAILGAGTGLGQAAVMRIGASFQVAPSEGGHADFGPRTPLEDRLVVFLRGKFGRASRDRILSGSGLALLYEFLKHDGFARESPATAAELDSGADPAAVVSRLGLAGRDRLARAALDLFASIYGSEAGNLALQYRATGGVFVGGGIAPKILPALRRPGFRKAFGAKPPMEDLLARIPVRVVLDPRLALYGAAAAAFETAKAPTTTRRSRRSGSSRR
jgi:glucokinase